MDIFEILVKLKSSDLSLFVVPFEIKDSNVARVGYLLVNDDVSLGSIFIAEDLTWVSKDRLPWDNDDLQEIGQEIEHHYFSTV